MLRLLLVSVVLAFPSTLMSRAARGGMIPITNASFEDQVISDGTFIRGTLTGWSVSGDAGVYNPTTAQIPGQAPDGQNVAYIGGTFVGGPITQTLSSVLMAGTYELSIDVGDRLDLSYAGYSIGLLAGGSLLAQDTNSLTPGNGTFVTSLVTFTALSSDPHLGQALSISLSAPSNGNGRQTEFDDVRLQFTPAAVPEPASIISLILGGIGVVGYVRRRRHAA